MPSGTGEERPRGAVTGGAGDRVGGPATGPVRHGTSATHGGATGRAGGRERKSPWPWRLAATAAGVALCGGLMLVLPVPGDARGGPGVAAAGRAAGGAGLRDPGPAYFIVIEEETGPCPEWPEDEAGLAPRAPGDAPVWPGGPAHTRTRPS